MCTELPLPVEPGKICEGNSASPGLGPGHGFGLPVFSKMGWALEGSHGGTSIRNIHQSCVGQGHRRRKDWGWPMSMASMCCPRAQGRRESMALGLKRPDLPTP